MEDTGDEAQSEVLETVAITAQDGTLIRSYVRARGTDGQFLPAERGDSAALKRAKRKSQSRRRHLLTEKDYLKSMARQLDTVDIRRVVASLVKDAVDGEDKRCNAAREWLGKYALGNGKHSLDLVMNPEVIQGKR